MIFSPNSPLQLDARFVCQFFLALLLTLSLSACVSSASKPSLYQQLGGEQGLDRIVEELIQNIGNDKKVFHFFADAKLSRFRTLLTEHLCEVSDGPCKYSGDSMEDIHTGMHIDEADFNHIVELLIDAMNKADAPVTAQNKLLARLAPMRKDIYRR
ncbi:group I truncated hemoglobin [Teredinibacter waterburyi]|jgi:Truncated hemoglobins|uniref:group I truncated hemoglobin n=1 Tax=Teredinibacter waterburyi TaxID=1500538 RepID=UPI00165F80CD|nr:group 1 truncated hemoglobin [Teredinibacter waterburyi]